MCWEPKAIPAPFPFLTLPLLRLIQLEKSLLLPPLPVPSPCHLSPAQRHLHSSAPVAFLLKVLLYTTPLSWLSIFNLSISTGSRGILQAGCDHQGYSWNPFHIAAPSHMHTYMFTCLHARWLPCQTSQHCHSPLLEKTGTPSGRTELSTAPRTNIGCYPRLGR